MGRMAVSMNPRVQHLSLVLALAGVSSTTAAQWLMDACPNADYRSLPFVGDPARLNNITDWGTADAQNYVEKEVQPKVTGPIAYLALVLFTLLAYIGWRIFRCCCCCCLCCRSCKKPDGSTHIIGEKYVKWVKVAAGVSCVISVAICLYGIGIVDRELVLDVWQVVTQTADFANKTQVGLDNVIIAAKGINPIMSSLDNLMKQDVNIPQLKGYLQCTGNILDGLPNPSTMRAKINSINSTIENTLKPTLNRLQTELTTLQTQTLPSTTAALNAIANITNFLNSINTGLNDYDSALTVVNGWTVQTSTPELNTFEAAQRTMEVSLDTWITSIDNIKSSLNYLSNLKANNSLNQVNTDLTTLTNAAATLRDPQSGLIPAVGAQLVKLNALYNTTPHDADIIGCFSGLIRRCQEINTTVVQLDPTVQSAYNDVASMYKSVNDLYSSPNSPYVFVTQLDSVSTSLVLPSDQAQLQSSITNATANLNNLQNQSSSTTHLDTIRSGINNLKTPVAAVRTSFNNHKTANNATSLTNLQTSVAAAKILVATANSAASAPLPSEMTNAINTANDMKPDVANFGTRLPTMLTSIADAKAALATLPNTADLTAPLDTVITTYNTLPQPKPSKVVEHSVDFMDTLYDAGVTVPHNAWGDINDTISTFQGQTDKIGDVVDQMQDLEKDHKKKSDDYFQMAVQALWGLYALLAAFVIITLIFAIFNYTWGLRLWPALVLILITLMLLLAVVWALLLVVFNDVCYNMESLILEQDFVDAKISILLRFYMLPQKGNGSAVQVLKDAGIIDVDQILGDVRQASGKLTDELQDQFTLRPKAQAIVTSANQLTDSVVGNVSLALKVADHANLHHLYFTIKHWVCCQFTDFGRNQWVALSISCLFAWIMMLVLFAVISAIDQTSRTCMGCECLPSHRTDVGPTQAVPAPYTMAKKKDDKLAEVEMAPPDSPRISTAMGAGDSGFYSRSAAPSVSGGSSLPLLGRPPAGGSNLGRAGSSTSPPPMPNPSAPQLPSTKLEPLRL